MLTCLAWDLTMSSFMPNKTNELTAATSKQQRYTIENNNSNMPRSRRTKDSFKRDDQSRVILGSAKEMAEWVRQGFEEQDKSKTPDDEDILKNFIEFRNCVLYISYPIGSKTHTAEIFNLCEMAGVVPGIVKLEGDLNYLFEVQYDIRFDGSLLYGYFFHYVKFDGTVSHDNVYIRGPFSGYKCLFD